MAFALNVCFPMLFGGFLSFFDKFFAVFWRFFVLFWLRLWSKWFGFVLKVLREFRPGGGDIFYGFLIFFSPLFFSILIYPPPGADPDMRAQAGPRPSHYG